jgi:acyl-CoA reductase-like NAD-dependent aldehyde dehydrogenase
MAYRMLIGGNLVSGARTLEVVNPATGRPFATSPRADAAQLDAAIAAAKAAFPAWSALPRSDRGARLKAIAMALERQLSDFARLLTLEQGKPLGQARVEIGGAVATLRAFADMSLEPAVLRQNEREKIVQQRSPLGVVAGITPWNFPVLLLAMKVAPTLLTGNTLIAKPAPTTPLTTLAFGELAAEFLPPGVLSTIVDANDLGATLTSHPSIAKVSFTGSTATGRRVMESAAPTLKRLTLELGGNDAAIVLDDVDVDTAARQVFAAATLNSGQVCLAAKRAYVPRAIYEPFCASIAHLARRAVVGDGLEPATEIGPIQNQAQFEKVKGFLEDAHSSGRVIAGGAALDREGFFIAPTIVRDIPDSARLVREEQFAPVLPILSYEDIDDAIRRANDSEFGLGGTVWTSDPGRGYEVASRIQTGTVWVNKHMDLPFDVPFGGAKQSGLGVEFGEEGLAEFTQQRIVNVAL